MSMQKPITRKQFLDLGLGAISLVGLAACGGDDSEDEGAGTGDDTTADTTASTTNTTTASTTDTTTASTSATTNSTTDSTTVSTTDDDTTESSTTDGDDTTTDGDTTTGDTTDGDTTTGSANMCDADPTSSFDQHMHTLEIPLADVLAGNEQSYVAGGNHMHDVTLTADDFATLQETGQVVVQSSFDNQHMHSVTITCA